MVFYNPDEIQSSVDGERKAQPYMDKFYQEHGWPIVDRSGSCRQFDCVLRNNGTSKVVEEKFRTENYGDFAIEIKQRTEPPTQDGWFYETDPDYLVYVVCENDDTWVPAYIYRVYWTEFKEWLIDEYLIDKKKQVVIFSPKGIGLSMNLVVKWSDIPDRLYKKFSHRRSIGGNLSQK